MKSKNWTINKFIHKILSLLPSKPSLLVIRVSTFRIFSLCLVYLWSFPFFWFVCTFPYSWTLLRTSVCFVFSFSFVLPPFVCGFVNVRSWYLPFLAHLRVPSLIALVNPGKCWLEAFVIHFANSLIASLLKVSVLHVVNSIRGAGLFAFRSLRFVFMGANGSWILQSFKLLLKKCNFPFELFNDVETIHVLPLDNGQPFDLSFQTVDLLICWCVLWTDSWWSLRLFQLSYFIL